MIRVLKDKGCRLTPQRLALLRILSKSAGHPSAEQIFEQIRADYPTTSLATIYKTLSLLKDMGEVFEATEYNAIVEIARELEKQALADDYFTSRKL